MPVGETTNARATHWSGNPQEPACWRRRWVSCADIDSTDAFASKPAPTVVCRARYHENKDIA